MDNTLIVIDDPNVFLGFYPMESREDF
jgi:hypothetical protein